MSHQLQFIIAVGIIALALKLLSMGSRNGGDFS